jgi:hypothetical protein
MLISPLVLLMQAWCVDLSRRSSMHWASLVHNTLVGLRITSNTRDTSTYHVKRTQVRQGSDSARPTSRRPCDSLSVHVPQLSVRPDEQGFKVMTSFFPTSVAWPRDITRPPISTIRDLQLCYCSEYRSCLRTLSV